MAKATGIVRRIDNLGRVVIPQSVRRSLGWTANGGANGGGTPLEIFVDDHCVTLRESPRLRAVREHGGPRGGPRQGGVPGVHRRARARHEGGLLTRAGRGQARPRKE